MDCKFVVGQKVVCIFSGEWDDVDDDDSPIPKEGEVYEISAIDTHPNYPNNIGLQLASFNPDDRWNHVCFAPVQEKKTDISIFQEMLTKMPASIEA